jgi:hypothetical protein
MAFSFSYICLMYLSTLVLLIAWSIFSRRPSFRMFFALSWGLLLLLQGLIGYMDWQVTNSCTPDGSAIICSSPLWLTGLLMLAVRRNKVSVILTPLLCVVLPDLTLFICLHLMGATEPFQII